VQIRSPGGTLYTHTSIPFWAGVFEPLAHLLGAAAWVGGAAADWAGGVAIDLGMASGGAVAGGFDQTLNELPIDIECEKCHCVLPPPY